MAGATPNLFFYRIIGGAENGPVTIEQMGRLIADRRVTVITQVREKDCLIWRYANDFSALARFFIPKQQNTAGDVFSKPLAQLTANDLPQLVTPELRTWTTVSFFLFYVPTTLAIMFANAGALIGFRWIHDMHAAGGIKLPQVVPLWIILSVGACMVALCVAPLTAWIAYSRRLLNLPKFVLALVGSYLLPAVALAALELIFYGHEMRWIAGMLKP